MKMPSEYERASQLRIVSRTELPLTPRAESCAIRILIVDGHELFVEGIRTLLANESGMAVIGHAATRTTALAAAALRPDIILLETSVGEENTLYMIPDLLRISEGSRILILTGQADPRIQVEAVGLGAVGVLLKTESGSRLFEAIRKIHSGEVWLSRALVGSVVNGFLGREAQKRKDPDAVRIASLTPREYEVVVLAAEGLRNRQVAERLMISETTVRHYLTSIFDKLGVGDRLELIIYAYQHGLVRIAPAV